MTLSINYQNRVKKEIENTNKALNAELAYLEELQNKEMISKLKRHLIHLKNMLK